MLQEFVDQVNKTARKTVEGIHTALPGEITKFDADKCVATVQPKAKFKKPNGETMDFPTVSGVPVVFPQVMNQDATIAFPVKAGDNCLIVFAEKALDFWMYGKETDTTLWFDLTNAICIPGLFAKGNPVMKEACDNSAIIIDVKKARLSIKEDKIQAEVKGTKLTMESGKMDIIAPEVSITGNVTVTGDVVGKNISLSSHTHGGDSGGSTTAPR